MRRFIGQFIRDGFEKFSRWRNYSNSRKQAHAIRKKIVELQGNRIVDQKMIRTIKDYAHSTFGRKSYWPWLAVYTELRGEFVEGWIPDDFYTFELLPKFNPATFSKLSSIKSYDHQLFRNFSISPLAVFIYGRFYDNQQNPISRTEFLKIMDRFDSEVVIKRDEARSGKNILFKHSRKVKRKDFLNHHTYVIQPSVKQHENLHQLHPESVNSLRISTFLKPDGSVSVIHLSLRFGSNGDRIVNRSGLFVYLDSTGKVTSNAFDDIGIDRGEEHPDTNYRYKNLQVPSMSFAIEKCKNAHFLFPYIRFIAWDLYIDEAETPRLIEWNARRPDMWVNEARIGPLWLDEGILDTFWE